MNWLNETEEKIPSFTTIDTPNELQEVFKTLTTLHEEVDSKSEEFRSLNNRGNFIISVTFRI